MTDEMKNQDEHMPASFGDLWNSETRLDGRIAAVESNQKKLMVVLSQVVGTLAEMKESLATKSEFCDLRSDVLTRMDGFSGALDDFRLEWAHHRDGLMRHEARLDDHERRLGKKKPRPH